jgi:toxin-antitoxin system PIN domain toxin
MNVLVDTNILVYAAHIDSPFHAKANEYVESLRKEGSACLTWSILYEWARVTTHPRVFSRPLSPRQAEDYVLNLTSDPAVDILTETPNHTRFLRLALDDAPPLRGNAWHDAHIVALMLEHGIKTIASADKHFRLFRSIRVVDPTA